MPSSDELSEPQFYDTLDTVLPGQGLEAISGTPEPRVRFTRLDMSGVQEMHEYSVADKRFYDYLEYEPFKSIEDTRSYLAQLIDLEGEKHGRTNIGWFIRGAETGRVVGSARFVHIDYRRQSAAWGYGLSPHLWGQGYVQEVQRALLDYVFNKLRLHRLYGTALIANKQTISTLVSAGMKEEGVLRHAMRDHRGTYHDSWAYGMLYEDYRQSNLWVPRNSEVAVPRMAGVLSFDRARIESGLRGFLAEYGNLTLDTSFATLPYWDSLKEMELLTYLEGELGVRVSYEQMIQFKSIQSVLDTLQQHASTQ